MQSTTTTSRRLLSRLSSRIHPPLPLSPRESQQLLNLLTTSFRAHLDREHPLPIPEDNPRKTAKPATNGAASPMLAASSYATATRHIDSILTSPLFAVKPRRRGSESAAVDVIKDPMAWFVNEIAAGSATLPKAALCLEMLQSSTANFSQIPTLDKSPAAIFSEWLRNSGLDMSRQFVEMSMSPSITRASLFLHRLVTLLVAEGETADTWRWFIRSSDQRIKETGLDARSITTFRKHVLSEMVSSQANANVTKGIATFIQACRFLENVDIGASSALLNSAGGRLVQLITSNTTESLNPDLYQQLLRSTHRWIGASFNPVVEAMLWLHHPTEPTALPGLGYVKEPAITKMVSNLSRPRRQFVVRLCLGIARLSIQDERYADAQFAMQFTKDYFPEIVLAEVQASKQREETSAQRERREQANLEMLDGLALT
ncbi:hypothetical protein IAQ61_002557 [Plenodomus lingam]|nr:hypothetical protein IAQ61_002557 [Plenodomus lingam]